jgi:hypothetical protein
MHLVVTLAVVPANAGTTAELDEPSTQNKNGGPFDPPRVMHYRLVLKLHLPLARQRP